jgi:hypothetical protein
MYTFLKPYKTTKLIRIGSKNDGGYVVTEESVKNIKNVLSFGIYYNWDFERDLMKHSKIQKMILADPFTPIASLKSMMKLKERINNNPNLIDELNFEVTRNTKKIKYYIKKAKLYLTKYFQFHSFLFLNNRIVKFEPFGLESVSSNFMRTLDYFGSKLIETKNMLFKMDIEGSEYNLDFSNNIFKNVECLLIEFHDIEKNYERLKEIIYQLEKQNLYIFHIHLNNSSNLINGTSFSQTIELSFQQRHYFGKSLEKVSNKYPLDGIDSPCEPKMIDYELEF